MSGIARAFKPSNAEPQQATGHADGPDLLNQQQVCGKLGISYQTWIRWRKAGRTPQAVTLPSGRLKWRRDDIDAMAGKPVPRVSRFFGSVRGR